MAAYGNYAAAPPPYSRYSTPPASRDAGGHGSTGDRYEQGNDYGVNRGGNEFVHGKGGYDQIRGYDHGDGGHNRGGGYVQDGGYDQSDRGSHRRSGYDQRGGNVQSGGGYNRCSGYGQRGGYDQSGGYDQRGGYNQSGGHDQYYDNRDYSSREFSGRNTGDYYGFGAEGQRYDRANGGFEGRGGFYGRNNDSYYPTGGNYADDGYNRSFRGGGSFRAGGRSGYSANEDGRVSDNQIQITGLPTDVSDDDLFQFFCSVGEIKVDKHSGKPKVWMLKDRDSGKQKGEANVTYVEAASAQSALTWFNGKDFKGCSIQVKMAMVRSKQRSEISSYRGDRTHMTSSNDQPDFVRRPGDWTCSVESCQNTNFSWRTDCNKCKTNRPSNAEGGGPMRPNRAGMARNMPY